MEGVYNTVRGEVGPLPDSLFWYTLCMALFVFAVWVVRRFIDNNKETFDKHSDLIAKMGNCIIELTTMTKVHEVQIQTLIKKTDQQTEDIESLRDFYIVTYKK